MIFDIAAGVGIGIVLGGLALLGCISTIEHFAAIAAAWRRETEHLRS